MPRFYLHICEGEGLCHDDEGVVAPDLAAARAMAVEGLRDVAANEMKAGSLNTGLFIQIEDENRNLVMTVPFREAVHV